MAHKRPKCADYNGNGETAHEHRTPIAQGHRSILGCDGRTSRPVGVHSMQIQRSDGNTKRPLRVDEAYDQQRE